MGLRVRQVCLWFHANLGVFDLATWSFVCGFTNEFFYSFLQ